MSYRAREPRTTRERDHQQERAEQNRCLGGMSDRGDRKDEAGSIAAFMMLTTAVAAHVIARAAGLSGAPLWKGTLIDERREEESSNSEVPGL